MKLPNLKIVSALFLILISVNFLFVSAEILTPEQENQIETENQKFLQRFKNELNYSKNDYHKLVENVDSMELKLGEVLEQKINLSSQIKSLDDIISETEKKLVNIYGQTTQTENEIRLIDEKTENLKLAIEFQKQLLKEFVRSLYQEQNNYFVVTDDGEIEAFKMLLLDESIGSNLTKLKNIELLNETGTQIIEKINQLDSELKSQEAIMIEKKKRLDELKDQVVLEKEQLLTQKDAKEKLLQMTLGQEEIFNQLLAQSIAEQNAVLNEIKSLNNAVLFIEDRIAQEGLDFDPSKYASLLSDKNKSLYEFEVRYRGIHSGEFDWPVEPKKGISAYFRDPSYVGVFGVKHNAIDLPTFQGTPVRAASDGVIYTVKDNGYGYSYIIVVHSGGLSTVYGHMSKMLVKEGDLVMKGSIIGLSGGMPGTKGAGYMTTGPHLHFEMLDNGSYVDPLNYMPLFVLTEAQIKALPEKYFESWLSSFPKAETLIPRKKSLSL